MKAIATDVAKATRDEIATRMNEFDVLAAYGTHAPLAHWERMRRILSMETSRQVANRQAARDAGEEFTEHELSPLYEKLSDKIVTLVEQHNLPETTSVKANVFGAVAKKLWEDYNNRHSTDRVPKYTSSSGSKLKNTYLKAKGVARPQPRAVTRAARVTVEFEPIVTHGSTISIPPTEILMPVLSSPDAVHAELLSKTHGDRERDMKEDERVYSAAELPSLQDIPPRLSSFARMIESYVRARHDGKLVPSDEINFDILVNDDLTSDPNETDTTMGTEDHVQLVLSQQKIVAVEETLIGLTKRLYESLLAPSPRDTSTLKALLATAHSGEVYDDDTMRKMAFDSDIFVRDSHFFVDC